MPRSPIAGIAAGAWGLAWTALGLVLAAWAATAAIDAQRGMGLATLAFAQAGIDTPDGLLALAFANLPVVGIAGVAALVAGLVYLRRARVAFRPWTQSQDGRGELLLGPVAPRAGRPFEGVIRLVEAPVPGDPFELVLAGTAPGAPPYRAEQRAAARHGAHGVNLPFRFDVPVSAPNGPGARWRLEFAPAGKRGPGRSFFDVTVGAPEPSQARAAVLAAEAAPAPAGAAAQGYVEHLEKLYGAFGGRLTDAQRQRIRAGLSDGRAQHLTQQLDAFRRLKPEHVRLAKYVLLALVAVFFVIPVALGILGVILAAVFGP